MKRSLGRNWRGALWAFTLLLVSGGGVLAQAPEQHWQPTPNYPANYPPNYQPSTAPAGPPATGNPVAGQPIQGPPVPVGPPKAPFVLSPPEAAALDNLLNDWEKRNKQIHLLESKFFRWKYDSVFGGNQPPAPEE